MKGRYYAILIGLATIMGSMHTVGLSYIDLGPGQYKIPNKKIKQSYNSGKTFYQNPNLKQNHYYNKTIPRGNKLSCISLKGKEIKANNKRKSIENRLKSK